MLDNKPWQPSSPRNKNCVYVVLWPPSVNSEVHPAAPCEPPPSTFLHSTVGKKQLFNLRLAHCVQLTQSESSLEVLNEMQMSY